MIPLMTSFLFGKKAYKKVFGYFLALNTSGYALGVPLANLAYDLQGTYKNMILALVFIMLFSAVAQQLSFRLALRDRA